MSDNPNRPWFQIHLSTAIVLSMFAAFFTFKSFTMRPQCWKEGNVQCYERGWPVVMHQYSNEFKTEIDWKQRHYAWGSEITYTGRVQDGLAGEWNVQGMLIDGLTALTGLVVVGFMSEAIVRRREASKQ